MPSNIYKEISSLLDAYKTCERKSNIEWKVKHYDSIKKLIDKLPFNCTLDFQNSNPEKLIVDFTYEEINDAGYSNGYKPYELVITPSLQFGIKIRIIGENKHQVKDYFHDCFSSVESEEN